MKKENELLKYWVLAHENTKDKDIYLKKGERMFPEIEEWAELWLKNEKSVILKNYLSQDMAENGKVIPEHNKDLVRYILKQRKK
jgi:hypothetical protein